MALIDVTEKDFQDKVINSPSVVLIDFWAPWCGPCKLATPVLEELSQVHKDKIIFTKVNVDENPNLTSKYSVMSIPTTILLKDGKEIGRQIGFAGKAAFEELLQKGVR